MSFNEKINVISDNNTGMSDLVKYVYSKGHRKIAYIHGEGTIVTTGISLLISSITSGSS